MKKIIVLLIFIGVVAFSTFGFSSEKKGKEVIKKEILATLESFNNASKNRDLSHFIDLFDKTPEILLVGSASGEVFKGKEQMEGWLKKLFLHNSFSWQMDRTDIDNNGKTAWVFMEGFMIVANDNGQTSKFPYRFTGIMIKVNNNWKWRLFNGSVPASE
jgi:ketosteroid isomerase-like protein